MPNIIYHKRSSVQDKTPEASSINYGEICVNYNKDNEFLAIKNSGNDVVKFKMHTAASDVSFDTANHASTAFTGTNVETSIAQLEQTVLDNETALLEKADITHTHDDRYYTETEVDTKLAGKSDIEHTHDVATTATTGFMSAADKTKLDGIASGATKITVDSSLSSSSTNPVQNKVINTALAGKSATGHTHDDRYYTETEVDNKLAGKSDTGHTHAASDVSFDTANHASTAFTGTNVETSIKQVEQTVLDNEAVCSEAYNSLDTRLQNKQDTLTSGTNIKTINGNTLLGSGNIEITTSVTPDSSLSSASTNPVQNKVIYTALQNKQDTLTSGTNIKTINGESLLGSGNIEIVSSSDTAHTHTAADISFNTASHASTAFTGTNVETSIAQVEQTVLDNEAVCSEAYNSLDTRLLNKQDTLTSGANIKTINGNTLLGSGNIEIDTSITVDSSLSSSSTNPVQNKIINTALAGKSDTGHTHDVATTTTAGFMSATDKTKLDTLSYTIEENSSATPTVDLQPNYIYDLTSRAITSITIQQTTANADDFKSKESIVRFMAASTVPTINVTLGSSPVRWQGGAIPVFQSNCYYEFSFMYVLGGYNIAMQTFKTV